MSPPDRPGPAVPLLDLQAQYRPLRRELLAAVERVCDSQRFILGPEVEALEAELGRALETRHAITVSSGTDALLAVAEPPGDHYSYNQYVIRVPDRDRVRADLAARGIGTEVSYPVPFHLQECFAGLGYRRGAFPRSEEAADTTLALPISAELTEAQQSAVVNEVVRALRL